ncbi:MAG: DUF6159 family protein [Acidimicrobiaceae bacterium]|nr:DUF6159 family protein [Acidimicrobiaceae bacterium]MXV87805.1 hypothetical protein [Acidimicrobiales bacterium]MCY3608449.1 DUF6159 family protein [Acidimicrobiaceae bacterium]MCY3948871.1 DUF6159 family protein [Acidimicrobiaceae bacterium]MDE0320941.1 DUF6159 family protein [Acidimicrobiaceae bacterium]
MGRFANTWRLTKNSWSLLKQDRELLWLPVLSMLTILAIVAAAAVVGFVTGSFDASGGAESVEGSAVVLGLVFAFVATATVVYFEGALVAGAHERMTGGDPTVRSAMSKAASRLPSLLGWALITMTVGLVLRFLRERLGWLGQMLTFLAEAAWGVATYLVVPAIIIDDFRSFASVKHSMSLVRRTWGENLIAQAGFGLLGFVIALPIILVAVLIATLVPGIGLYIGIAVGVIGVLAVSVVVSALSLYFKTALYEYATDGVAHGGFDIDEMEASFRSK